MKKSLVIKLSAALFFLAATLDILGIFLDENILRYVFKPLIIPLLAILYITQTSKINYRYLFGLFFCFLGDVFLMFEGDYYFTLGLGSFLFGHLVFISIVLNKIGDINLKNFLISAIPFTTVFVILIYLTYAKLGGMLLPVIVYALVISTFGTFTLYYYGKVKTQKAFLLALGAFIFILSDASIAIDMFYVPKAYFAPLIMITYVIAQYLICRAFVETKIT